MFKKKLNKKPFVVTEIKLFVRANFFLFFFFCTKLNIWFLSKNFCLKLKKSIKKVKKNIQHSWKI